MWETTKETWKNFTTGNTDLIRHVSVAIFGAVARLATDHARIEKFTIQAVYDIFRTVLMALVAVYICDAIILYFQLNGTTALAASIGAAYYAQEVVTLIKGVLPAVKDKLMKRLK